MTLKPRAHRAGAALRQGYLAIASGMVDVALVVGVEKSHDKIGPDVERGLANHKRFGFEAVQGRLPRRKPRSLCGVTWHEYQGSKRWLRWDLH